MNRIFKFVKWFYPGLKIKRWICLLLLGIILIFSGSSLLSATSSVFWRFLYTFIFIAGVIALGVGLVYFIKSIFEALYPRRHKKHLIDIIYEQRLLSRGPRVVAIGGGTGLSTLLLGLKEYTSNITAIVTVADEGGSSGRLRQEFGILPPGDIRNCLVALAEAPQLMLDLFQHRFQEGEGIKGHTFGNLFITAMTQVTGSFQAAIEESSRVLAIRGRVIPASLEKIRLKAEYDDGTTEEGENRIPQRKKFIKRISIIPEEARANPEVMEAIRDAEIIVLGPGSLFTSILPNLLIREIRDEIAKKEVLKVYICNVMTQDGETNGFTAADHLEVILNHAGRDIVNYCLVNAGRLDDNLLVKYAQERSFPVVVDRTRLENMGVKVLEDDFVSRTNYLRHNAKKTAKRIIGIYNDITKGKWKE